MRITPRRKTMWAVAVVASVLGAAGTIVSNLGGSDNSVLVASSSSQPVDEDGFAMPDVPSSEPPAATPTPESSAPAAPAAVAPETSAPQKSIANSTGSGGGVVVPSNAAGWRLVFSDDFSTSVGLGGFASSGYGPRYYTYTGKTTYGGAAYDTSKVVSVSNGILNMFLHTENGQAYSAALVPQVPGGGQTYGRYEVRVRADPTLAGYKAAFLLWPDSNNWNEGEIDFPEAPFTGRMSIHDHCVGHTQDSCYDVETNVTWGSWHTVVTEWAPGQVTFYIDGVVVGQSTMSPSSPMHMVLQTESDNSQAPPANVAGNVQIDYVRIWARA